MVRKDPLKERGPVPPSGRDLKPIPKNLFQLRPVEEYKNLWDCAILGAEEQLKIITLYTRLKMPVDYLEGLERLQTKIETLIKEAQK